MHVKKRRHSGLRQGFLACAIGIADRSMYQLLIIRCTSTPVSVLNRGNDKVVWRCGFEDKSNIGIDVFTCDCNISY